MAMTLRLDEQETDALRRRAQLEGRSMQDVARQAVRDYIERTSKRELLDRVLDEELPRYAEALERLGPWSSPARRTSCVSRAGRCDPPTTATAAFRGSPRPGPRPHPSGTAPIPA